MGAVTLTVVTLNKDSLISADAAQNSFVFLTPLGAISTEITAIETALNAFYNTITVSGHTVNEYLALDMTTSANANTFEHYNLDGHLDGSAHGSPISSNTWTLAATGGSNSPPELAIAISFHSAYGSDVEFGAGGTRPRARDRGRIYLGPLTAGGGAISTSSPPVLNATTVTALAQAAARLRDDANTVWAQWSRAAAEANPVTAGWVDNAPDVQRRRGLPATARTTW